ncbi:MAG: lysophospholipid acyltransferase family protein [Clostridiales bacterium]|nr:lysophospholipid acyltransferase family protein [Clostridiales bacterium]
MLVQALRSLFFLLPRRFALLLGEGAGDLLFFLDGRHRRLALANLKKALGNELSTHERRLIARKSFLHFGRMLADNLKWAQLGESRRQELLKLEGEENIRQALDRGNGVLLFSAHFGNWEVASLALSRLGGLHVVARPLDSRPAERELFRFRTSLGAKIIYKHQAAKPILQALRRNEMVAILIDQNVLRSEAVFVDFFGLPAATTPSLASFHLRTHAPIVPVFCYPTPLFSYLVKIAPPLDVELTGDREEDVLKITQRSTKIIESEIRARPDLWFWFHNRWKTRPEGKT